MNSRGSITQWIEHFQADDPHLRQEAAQHIWEHYSHRLLKLARTHLQHRIRRREDEHDVLQSMYKSFCLRQEHGAFDLASRDDLWQVLVTITLRKVRNLAKRHLRERRDYRREQVQADAAGGTQESLCEAVAQIAGTEPTPEDAALLSEELQRRLEMLPEALRQIALWKLEGYTNEEIAGAGMLDCAVRTVERKLKMIRQKWEVSSDSET